MVIMEKYTNFIIPIVSLFLFCWLGPVIGVRNKFMPPFPSPAGSPGMIVSSKTLCKDKVYQYDYVCQDHLVRTGDGFIVSLARIPGGRGEAAQFDKPKPKPKPKPTPTPKPTPKPKKKPAILLQHGVLCDGVMYLLLGKDSLALYLADSGFDVWIANSRGTEYSLGHETLIPTKREYWDWSWDDLTIHELPAMVDYIRNQTGQEKIHYIGHSMGTLQVLAALADRMPVVNHLKSVVLLSPIGYLNHITSPLASISANLFMGQMRHLFGAPDFDVFKRPASDLFRLACSFPGVDCSNALNGFTGQNCCIDPKRVTEYFEHEPQPSSTRVMAHLCQNIRTGVISRYDYLNSKENMNHYGHATPPVFNMTNIPTDMPLYLAYGGLDSLADYVDVKLLLRDLKGHDKNKIEKKFTLEYAHMDFLMARDAKKVVYEPLVPFLKKHS